MQSTTTPNPAPTQLPPEPRELRRHPIYRRFLVVYLVLLALLLLALLPPLVNVNRFKRRIVTSISTTLGRPVHLDSVTLNLLPLPSFTLENFVVEEDPRFGAEPIIRASSVRATLRASSLWSRKVEFSRIVLTDASLNLVHTPDGHWNVESILLQAAQITAAPTAQPHPGLVPRFPYIEATGARINLKSGDNGLEKLPFALTDSDLALWLPTPAQWHIRLEGHPARTDTNASDTGTVELEGTLARATAFDQIPLDLTGLWKNAPLGEASLVLLGRDANLRGALAVSASIHGTLAEATVKARARITDLRRADFVPQRPIDIDAECQATATDILHAFHQVRCSWPPPSVSGPRLLALTGDLPDIHHPTTASFELGTPGLPAATLLNWLHVASARLPLEETATGTLTAKLSRDPASPAATASPSRRHAAPARTPSTNNAASPNTPIIWAGDLLLHGGTLTAPGLTSDPIHIGDLALASSGTENSPNQTFLLAPTTLNLGGKDPAVLEGHFDATGYTLRLTGSAIPTRLVALAAALPQFGEGLSDLFPTPTIQPTHIDLTTTRPWSSTTPHPWTRTLPTPTPAKHRRHR